MLQRNATNEALRPSETSDLKRATGRDIPEDGILHSHRRENLISYSIKQAECAIRYDIAL
jgi:hypothetical protein